MTEHPTDTAMPTIPPVLRPDLLDELELVLVLVDDEPVGVKLDPGEETPLLGEEARVVLESPVLIGVFDLPAVVSSVRD